jgi:hypothetical protein
MSPTDNHYEPRAVPADALIEIDSRLKSVKLALEALRATDAASETQAELMHIVRQIDEDVAFLRNP